MFRPNEPHLYRDAIFDDHDWQVLPKAASGCNSFRLEFEKDIHSTVNMTFAIPGIRWHKKLYCIVEKVTMAGKMGCCQFA